MADNPFERISNTLAEELTASRRAAEKSRVVGFGQEAVDLATVRARLEEATPEGRIAILQSLRKNKDYPTKLKQLVRGWRGANDR